MGSEDREIRVFLLEEVIYEATEVDIVSGLTAIRDTLFGYSLANGTIGVYNNDTRVWHAKSKHKVMCVNAFDLDNDGVPELIAGETPLPCARSLPVPPPPRVCSQVGPTAGLKCAKTSTES